MRDSDRVLRLGHGSRTVSNELAPRRRRGGSLRSRLAAVLAVTVAMVVLVVAVVTYAVVAYQLGRSQDVALLREATRIQRLLQTGSDFLASGSDACLYAAEPACTRTFSARDHIEGGRAVLRITPEALSVAEHGGGPAFATVDAPGRRVRTVVLSTTSGSAVMVGIPTTTTDQTLDRTGFALLVLGVVGILLSGLIGHFVAGWGLRPVRQLAVSIDRVARTRDPRDGVETDRDDELGRLGRAFTAMLGELAMANAAQRQLVSDASHELRTPLTTLRTNFALLSRPDGLSDDTRARLRAAMEQEILQMQELVADLVDLARGDEPVIDIEVIDLAQSVRRVLPQAARHWPDASFHLVLAEPDSLIEGSRGRLERLVSVLLDNAGKHGAPPAPARDVDVDRPGLGAQVEVEIARRASSIVLTVADRGAGIAEDELGHVFDRFYRSPSARSRPGSGLGLAIADQIVTSFHGTIAARRRDGGGTIVEARFPGFRLTDEGPRSQTQNKNM